VTRRPGLGLRALACAAALALPATALAEGSKVEVMADVVLSSNQGNKVDPPSLEEMKQTFAAKNIKFSSWQSLSQRKLTLEQKKAVEVPLPNGKKAQVTLEQIKEDVAHLRVAVPPASTELQLGREGKLYVDGGQHQGGQLWLVISPALKPQK
jgi:hypothetical protein